MKSIRNLVTLIGLSVMLFALGVSGAKAQEGPGLSMTNFAGTFTLPSEAQWGRMTLPAGDYSLYYGSYTDGGPSVVEIVGKGNASPHGFIFAQQPERTSAGKNAIVCVREGDTLIVRALQMAAIGQSASFAMPTGAQLTAKVHNGSTKTLLASAPMLIERVPVTLNGK